MRVGGCVRRAVVAPLVACLCACVHNAAAASKQHEIPVQIKVWDTGRSPLSHMVDVTNSFGLKVLAEHNFLNDNNIAFSPYGLMGILVALYEGVDGESSFEMQQTIQLPWNRNIMRVGFRDIHRTLKTYFVPEEGFLAGLALNNENVTFNNGYKNILRFYGFDLNNNDQLPTRSPAATDNNTTTTPTPEMPAGTTTTMASSGGMPAREETTPNPNAETISAIDSSTNVTPSSASNAETTTNMPSTSEQTTVQTIITEITTMAATTSQQITPRTTPLQETTVTSEPTTTTSAKTETTTTPMTTNVDTTMSTTTSDVETIASSLPPTPTGALTDEPANNNVVDEFSNLPTTSETSASTATTSVETSTTETEQTEPLTSTTEMPTTEPNPTTLSDSSLETLQRKKKSIVNFIYTNPPYLDDYVVFRSFNVPAQNALFDNNMFLTNGLKYVQVSYMHYNAVLPHAYLPHLEACALKLPLDSDRYYLLVILPDQSGTTNLRRLLSRMARESDLSDVYASLRPKRVRAIVPSFMVKGHVILTTDLQKLGIRTVFEPRQFDFTPMTRQPGVYVRSVEQAVSVAITKYQPDDVKSTYMSRYPISFSATYPFLYFVMDSSINVAIMAGKMVDPLNSRIL